MDYGKQRFFFYSLKYAKIALRTAKFQKLTIQKKLNVIFMN